MSSDAPDELAPLQEELGSGFLLLSDPDCATIDAYGLLHVEAGPGGRNAARPATFVVGEDRRIVWSRPASSVMDRPAAQIVFDRLAEARARP